MSGLLHACLTAMQRMLGTLRKKKGEMVCFIICFHFLPHQVCADDEASTRLLQIFLFLLLSTASLMFIPCAVRSSFMLSIHFFGCLPVLHNQFIVFIYHYVF